MSKPVWAVSLMTLILLASLSFRVVSARSEEEVLRVLDWTPQRMVIEINGSIGFFEGAEFKKLAGGRRGGVLLLRSNGGDVTAAMTLGRTVRELGWTTSVPMHAECYSGCSMIWAAGTNRHVGRGAVLGFHGPYGLVDEDHITQGIFGSSYYADYYRDLGFSEAATQAFMHPPPDLFMLTKGEALRLGVEARFD